MFESAAIGHDFTPGVENYLAELKVVIDTVDIDQITVVMHRLLAAYERGASVYIFGNGGSASTASHLVKDFNSGVNERLVRKFRFYCLNDNVATVLAVANDISYDEVFALQLRNYLRPSDIVIAISGSGNSTNVLNAVRLANAKGVETVGLVGFDGGELARTVDSCIHVPVHDMQKVEDLHFVINHVMVALLKEHLEYWAR
ncbi:D-sedoheptulose-7-phosphate isomerase [Polymorphospora rubra]|uniref:D-sedoheptulose-7-phosphate isomerase n=1 Tax=Polymorphospora rubra TaxID=338584 RepID=UPI0033C66DAD